MLEDNVKLFGSSPILGTQAIFVWTSRNCLDIFYSSNKETIKKETLNYKMV